MTREPVATHRIGHVTDSHFTASGTMHGSSRPAVTYSAALEALEGTGIPLAALVHTGDIADSGEAEAYVAARAATQPVAVRTGWPVLYAAGNHDVRATLREHLLGGRSTDDPLVHAVEIHGLRVVVLDTSIPDRVEGAVDDEQLAWLRATLAEPAEHGTVVAMHHPPVPVEITGLQRLHLTAQQQLAAVLAGTDVRAILAGHLHYATSGTFAGIPVYVAPATAYTIRLTAPGGGVVGVDGGRAAGVLSLYDDGRVGYSALPTEPMTVLATTPDSVFDTMGVDVER